MIYIFRKSGRASQFLRKYKDIDCVYNDIFLIDVHDNVVKKLKSDYDDLNQNDFFGTAPF